MLPDEQRTMNPREREKDGERKSVGDVDGWVGVYVRGRGGTSGMIAGCTSADDSVLRIDIIVRISSLRSNISP